MHIRWCRHDDCGKPYESDAGFLPPICPACQRVAAWSSDPEAPKIAPARPEFTVNDKRFLKSLRIAAS